jgi:hypothetical protein
MNTKTYLSYVLMTMNAIQIEKNMQLSKGLFESKVNNKNKNVQIQ